MASSHLSIAGASHSKSFPAQSTSYSASQHEPGGGRSGAQAEQPRRHPDLVDGEAFGEVIDGVDQLAQPVDPLV